MSYDNKLTFKIILNNSESTKKIGKLSSEINAKKCQMISDGKIYKLLEKKDINNNHTYIGSLFAEQSSKYLMIKFDKSTNKFEATPVGDWYLFKKGYTIEHMSLEEAEAKMKEQSKLPYLNNLKKKGNEIKEKLKKNKQRR